MLQTVWPSDQTGPSPSFGSVAPQAPADQARQSMAPLSPSPAPDPGPQHLVRADARTVLVTPEQTSARPLLPEPLTGVARPTRLACGTDSLYFLARGQLYRLPLQALASGAQAPQSLMPPQYLLPSGERIRELLDLTLVNEDELLLLDKSNDFYRYVPSRRQWSFALKARPALTQPDPHYVALSTWQGKTYLLDYARNQIQRFAAGQTSPYFKREIMSWELKPGDPSVADALALHVDGQVYTLNRNGTIFRFHKGLAEPRPLADLSRLPGTWRPPAPRALRGQGGLLYAVDAANRRVVALDARSGGLVRQWLLAGDRQEWDYLHDVAVCGRQVLALAGNQVFALPDAGTVAEASVPEQALPLDERLQGFTLPIRSALLPDHAGIYPGARRLYRYGIHEGADFFDRYNPQAGGKLVAYGSPVVAVKAGRVARADRNFREMTPAEQARVLAACQARHETSRADENRFRGRQVWIEHPGGLTTIYAHLSALPPGLRVGQNLAQGEVIGYVGNSGTSNGVAGNRGNPHLHLEIWLSQPDDPIKGEYLGKWLSLSETQALWERVFGKK